MPTTTLDQLLRVIRSMRPGGAVRLLTAMPHDWMATVLSRFNDDHVGTMLWGIDAQHRAVLAGQMPPARVGRILAAAPPERARPFLLQSSRRRVAEIVEALPTPDGSRLLHLLPKATRVAVTDDMDAERVFRLRRHTYHRHALQALRSTAAAISVLPRDRSGALDLLVTAMGHRFGIAVRYLDRGALELRTVVSAETTLAHGAVQGVLVVTNVPPTVDVVQYADDRAGFLRTVTWQEDGGVGPLSRALVRLTSD